TVTLAAEHSALRETQDSSVTTSSGPGSETRTIPVVNWRTNTGVIAQGNFAFHDALFVTGGLRLERNGGYATSATTALLPMLGGAVVRDVGMATVKVRSAYGRGIRPVQTPVRAM